MSRLRLALVGVCVGLVASCGDNLRPAQSDAGTAPPLQQDAAPPGQPGIQFAASPEAAAQGTFATTFALYETRAITAIVSLPDAAGPRVLQLVIKNSEEAGVRTVIRAFATDAAAGTIVAQPATGVQLEVQKAQAANGMALVEIAIAVAGTDLSRYGLTGAYRAEVFLDGDQPVCTGTFELRGDQ